jgi:general secretion pathway protein I
VADRRPSGSAGFTLLEMLVALAVFSLAALSLIRLQGVTIRTAADLDGKVMGQIVAHNLMVDLRTDPRPPSMGEAQGDIDNGGKRWHWTRTAAPTEDSRLIRVDLKVEDSGGGSPAVLTFVRTAQ